LALSNGESLRVEPVGSGLGQGDVRLESHSARLIAARTEIVKSYQSALAPLNIGGFPHPRPPWPPLRARRAHAVRGGDRAFCARVRHAAAAPPLGGSAVLRA
jgi:hypothetical protein